MKKIHLSNDKGSSAELTLLPKKKKEKVRYIDENGGLLQSRSYVKSTNETNYDALLEKYGDAEAVGNALTVGDPEIDFELAGKYLTRTYRVYLNEKNDVVYNFKKIEKVFLPDGSLKEEREPKEILANVNAEAALTWSGEYIPKVELYNRFVFERAYQIRHSDGLSFDFLYEMAKDLHEKKSMMLIGSGDGKGPLVFMDNGKTFKGFLDGRIKDDGYCLILQITRLEYKSLPDEE